MKKVILVAGGTGNLGGKIITALLDKGAEVQAIVRDSSDKEKVAMLKQLGVKVFQVDMSDRTAVAKVCEGVSCVVSALAGLREVIIDVQKVLLDAAVDAGVPRFIPSDYSLDFTQLSKDENRNLGFRKEFHTYLDKAPIAATSILNGPFMELLTGEMPLILYKMNRVLYWGNADQTMDFTTMDDTAVYTANAALDEFTPRFLRIAGDELSARELPKVVSDVTGHNYRLFSPGGLGMLGIIIKIARFIAPGKRELYPVWQGMQYMHNMFDGRGKLRPLDNDRYPGMTWTTVSHYLNTHLS